MIISFQHAVSSDLNQGILTALFTVGSIVVLIGSVLILKEHVRFCEYLGVIMVLAGTVIISLSKSGSGEVAPATGTELSAPGTLVTSLPVITEGPLAAIVFALLGGIAFGARGLLLKYMGIKLGIDGVSASSIFLMTDGLL